MISQARRPVPLSASHPPSLSPRALAIVGWGSLVLAFWLFLVIAWDVSTHAELVVMDARVANWLHRFASSSLTPVMLAITHLHGEVGLALLAIAFAVVLWRKRERYWLVTLALAVPGGIALNLLLKHAYERARPHFDDPLVTLESYSFPSGHAAGATAFYMVVAAFLVSRTYDRRHRAAIVAGSALAVLLVAYSRMYLGAHYLSDVVAAITSTAAYVVLCLSAVHTLVRRRLVDYAPNYVSPL